mmetsp:Transcript_44629/g.137734  ORF Transcript_44629/g.137734 Transcript_44629/m.137734 type:complete len:207 (+) Transcript_44629:334-954(+)
MNSGSKSDGKSGTWSTMTRPRPFFPDARSASASSSLCSHSPHSVKSHLNGPRRGPLRRAASTMPSGRSLWSTKAAKKCNFKKMATSARHAAATRSSTRPAAARSPPMLPYVAETTAPPTVGWTIRTKANTIRCTARVWMSESAKTISYSTASRSLPVAVPDAMRWARCVSRRRCRKSIACRWTKPMRTIAATVPTTTTGSKTAAPS